MFFTNPEPTNLRFFFTKIYVPFFRGLQSVFFSYDKQLYRHFCSQLKTSIFCRKAKQRKIRRFIDSGIVKTCDELDLFREKRAAKETRFFQLVPPGEYAT